MLSKYMRTRVRLYLTASKFWTSESRRETAPCELCPPTKRLGTRTSLSGTYLGVQGRRVPRSVRVCYKCMGKLHLARELGRRQAELRLYAPRKARCLARVQRAQERAGMGLCAPSVSVPS